MKKKNSESEEYSQKIEFHDDQVLHTLSGVEHESLRIIADIFAIRVGARGKVVNLIGPKKSVKQAAKLFEYLGNQISQGRKFSLGDVRNAALRMSQEHSSMAQDFLHEDMFNVKGAKEVSPRGPGQKDYVNFINKFDLVFGVGPAGTGKTFLAMTLAVKDLLSEKISRIILTRPAVEAGEKLGFLPGNMEEKVSPYLRPLYDALFDLVGTNKAEHLVAHGVIEVAPLAFMRGRTLNDAFVILDEAQNTTSEQMKMALTRLGFGSKMVVTGDITQIDLAPGQKSGLVDAIKILQDVEGVGICHLTEQDVVRHRLVQSIIRAYREKN